MIVTARLLQTSMNKDERFEPKAGVYTITVPISRVVFQTGSSFMWCGKMRENAEKILSACGQHEIQYGVKN